MSLLILSENNKTTSAKLFRNSGGLIIFCVMLFLLTACGLPTYAYLYEPTAVVSRTNPSDGEYDLIFRNAYKNNINIFSGYEIYYKIYDPLAPETSATEYVTDRDAIDITSVAGETILKNKNFSRLFTTTTNDTSFIHNDIKPAFPIETTLLDEKFDIRLLFLQNQNAGSSYFAAPWESSVTFTETPYIYRYVSNDSTNTIEKKFFDIVDFDINDSDMPSSIDSGSLAVSDYLYISFYILSFGKDLEDITSLIYSVPVYLGTLKFDCDLTNN